MTCLCVVFSALLLVFSLDSHSAVHVTGEMSSAEDVSAPVLEGSAPLVCR